MSDEFSNNVAQKFPNTMSKDVVERPWDVTDAKIISPLRKLNEESKKDDIVEKIHNLYSELRSSLTIRSALEYDLKKTYRVLDEVNRIKAELEKIIEMLKAMEEYMKERMK